jgi:hypothetical protein
MTKATISPPSMLLPLTMTRLRVPPRFCMRPQLLTRLPVSPNGEGVLLAG